LVDAEVSMLNELQLLGFSLLILWTTLYLLYRIMRLNRFGVEFKPYLTILWRTKKLNRMVSRLAAKFSNFWHKLFTLGCFLAVGELLFTLNFFTQNILSFYRGGAVQPVIPLIPGITISLSSLHYFILAALLVFIFHEMSHAIAARIEGIKVKDIGLMFMVLIIGGFVELDDEDMDRVPLSSKLKILSSGSTMNLLTGIIATLLLINLYLVLSPLYLPSSGVVIVDVLDNSPADSAGIVYGDIILGINGIRIYNTVEFTKILSGIPANTTVILNLLRGNLAVKGGAHPYNPKIVYLGVRVFNYYPLRIPLPRQFQMFPWHLYNFLNWFEVISISAALINMLPIPFFDGDRFFENLFKHPIFNRRTIFFMNRKMALGKALTDTLRIASILLLLLNISQSMGFIYP